MNAARKNIVSAGVAGTPPRTGRIAPRTDAAEREAPDVGAMVESIIGCKWSLHVLTQVRCGVNRPGALVRSAEGLTTKVLNERLSKMLRFGILSRRAYPEVPLRVEYSLTPFGERFVEILNAVERLKHDAANGGLAPEVTARSR